MHLVFIKIRSIIDVLPGDRDPVLLDKVDNGGRFEIEGGQEVGASAVFCR